MIKAAIEYLIKAINNDFDIPGVSQEPQVVPGNIAFVDAYQDTSSATLSDKLIVSVVNITQERTFRNLSYRKASVDDNGVAVVEEKPHEIWLNIYILFGANRTAYMDSLSSISKIIGFFQRHYVFTPEYLQELVGDEFNVDLPGIQKLIFDLYSMNFDELNQLWGILGGKYIPSVMYQMRMLVIQEGEATMQKPIEAIGAEPNGK